MQRGHKSILCSYSDLLVTQILLARHNWAVSFRTSICLICFIYTTVAVKSSRWFNITTVISVDTGSNITVPARGASFIPTKHTRHPLQRNRFPWGIAKRQVCMSQRDGENNGSLNLSMAIWRSLSAASSHNQTAATLRFQFIFVTYRNCGQNPITGFRSIHVQQL